MFAPVRDFDHDSGDRRLRSGAVARKRRRHPAGRARPVRVAHAGRGVGDGRRGALGGGRRADKPGEMVADDVELAVAAAPAFVSRGGIKLANALDALGIDVAGRRALDVGASTGGFTDCLLQRGAAHVIAVDVGYGELDWRLRSDPRVTVLERTNARALDAGELPVRAGPDRRSTSRSSRSRRSCRPCSPARPPRTTASRWSSRSSRSAASGSARAASCATPALRRER